MQAEGTSEIGGKDEKPNQGTYDQRQQVEQPGKRKETQGIYDWVDKLFQVCGHEEPDGKNGQVATSQNPCGVLETMEKDTYEAQDAQSAPSTGVEGA